MDASTTEREASMTYRRQSPTTLPEPDDNLPPDVSLMTTPPGSKISVHVTITAKDGTVTVLDAGELYGRVALAEHVEHETDFVSNRFIRREPSNVWLALRATPSLNADKPWLTISTTPPRGGCD